MSVLSPAQGVKSLLCLLVFTLLAACATTTPSGLQPTKSANDDYQYRLVTLDNAMEVLLISDPETPKAAAALAVMVGSGDNPPGRAGLAHFLEHMLFLGTDKYPDAAEYEEFITEHGGSRNAYTSLELTNYFFDVNAPHLPEALDRFAQFFIAPRFDAQYVDREKNAVEAEYQMGLKSDSRRGLDVLQEVMNQEHPFSQFTVGSLDTLEDRPGSTVRDELLAFYDKHYSANVMRLVVLGAQSLDDMEALVVPMFSQVPNKSFELANIDAPFFTAESLPMVVEVQPLATLRELDVSFPIADYRPDYRENPLSYLGNLLGHEGEGSLLSRLKAEGLAEGLSAGSGIGWRGGALFSVNIALTEKGAADYNRVLQVLFAYTDMLRQEGPRDWLYAEQSRLSQLGFRYREQGNPIGYVSALASGMHHYAPVDTLRGPYIMEDYDAGMLTELLTQIRPDNAVVVFSDTSAASDTVSARYQVPYSQQGLSLSELAMPAGDAAAASLHLPAPNEFIAKDVSLVKLPSAMPASPQIAHQAGRQKIWFMPDEEFRLPKGTTYINFRSTEIGKSAQQAVMAGLYTALLMDQVNEFAYPARLAGLNFSFYKHGQGISLRVSGYNDKQALLLERLLANITDPDFDPLRFENIRKDMIRGLENSVAKRPSSQVMDDLKEALLYGQWGEQAMIQALQETTLNELNKYIARFWSGATAEVLVYGNYNAARVKQVSAMLEGVVPATAPPVMAEPRVLKLTAGEATRYAVDVPHDDSVVAWYLQGAGDSWQDRAATALTGQIMTSGFFQQLRTEQQLGYVVSAFSWTQLKVPGVVMVVQSPVADADKVTVAMEEFMQGVQPDLDKAQFERHKVALVSEILRPHKNLGERAEFYWQSIARKQLDFAGRQHLADAVEGLTMEEWQNYFQRVFLDQRHSLQVVTPGKWKVMPTTQARLYDNADAIKSSHDAYLMD